MQSSQEQVQEQRITMSFACKVAFTSNATAITLSSTTTIEELINYVNNNLKNLLHIHERYQLEVVETYKNEHSPTELGAKLEPTTQTIMERYGNPMAVTAFYLRPVVPEIGQFVRQQDYRT